MSIITNTTFTYSLPSTVLGVVLLVDISTVAISLRLWTRTSCRARHYLFLAIVAICHILDFWLGTFGMATSYASATTLPEDSPERSVALRAAAMSISSLVFAAVGGTGFIFINMTRLQTIASSRMPLVSKVLTGLTAISIATCLANNAWYIMAVFKILETGDSTWDEWGNEWFSVWSIFDAIVNTTISITFLVLLRRIGSSHTGGTRQRRGFLRMLTSVSWILGLECSLIIFANILVRIDDSLDPQWTTLYAGEALRMRLFVAFLQRLNRMLRNKPAIPAAATTMAQSQIGTATVDGVHSGGSGSLLSTMFATIRVRWKSVSTTDRISARPQHSQSGGGEGSNPHAHVQRIGLGPVKGSPSSGSREMYQLGFGRAAMVAAGGQTRSGSTNSLGKAGAAGGSNTSLNNKAGGSNGNLVVRTLSPLNPQSRNASSTSGDQSPTPMGVKRGAALRQSGDALNRQIAATAALSSPLSANAGQVRNEQDGG